MEQICILTVLAGLPAKEVIALSGGYKGADCNRTTIFVGELVLRRKPRAFVQVIGDLIGSQVRLILCSVGDVVGYLGQLGRPALKLIGELAILGLDRSLAVVAGVGVVRYVLVLLQLGAVIVYPSDRKGLLYGSKLSGIGDVVGYLGQLGVPTCEGVSELAVLRLDRSLAVIAGGGVVRYVLVLFQLGAVVVYPSYCEGLLYRRELCSVSNVVRYLGSNLRRCK